MGFHQHFVDQIDMSLTPLQWMMQEYPDVIAPEPLRAQLGRMGVSGSLQNSPFETLSDGQKTRCVLAWMAVKQPHFLILDEPTNHLDIESIDALAEGINDFEGAVVVVSHDLRLIAQIADEIWIADQGKCRSSRATSRTTRSSCRSRSPTSSPRSLPASARCRRGRRPGFAPVCADVTSHHTPD